MITAVIFDMDGVLVDSEIHWRGVISSFLAELVPGWSEENQQSIVGMSIRDVHAKLVDDHKLQLTFEQYLQHYDSLAAELYGVKSSLLPGVMPLVNYLKASGKKLGIASSSPINWISIVTERFGFSDFDAIVSADMVDGRGKPEPDIYTFCVKKLGVRPEEAVAIEDSDKGVESAKRAGLKAIGFRNGFNQRHRLKSADIIVSSLAEIDEAMLSAI